MEAKNTLPFANILPGKPVNGYLKKLYNTHTFLLKQKGIVSKDRHLKNKIRNHPLQEKAESLEFLEAANRN